MTALINALTAAKLDTDAKLKTECETVMNSTQYTDACKDALNAKTQELVTYVHYKPSDRKQGKVG